MNKLTREEKISLEAIKKRLNKAIEDGVEYHDIENTTPYKSRRDIAFLVNLLRKMIR